MSANTTERINTLACLSSSDMNDVHDLIELMYENYGDDGETKVGALCTVTLRALEQAMKATEEIEEISKVMLANEAALPEQ